MNDRELLELAAKAAGMEHKWNDFWGGMYIQYGPETGWAGGSYWNPLKDDGDALRLAVKLGISPDWGGFDIEVCRTSSGSRNFCYVELHNDDPYAATRRAIVRAAVEIGRSMA